MNPTEAQPAVTESLAVTAETAPRPGGVEMDDVSLIAAPSLEESGDFQRMNDRLRASEAIVESLRERGSVPKDQLLTVALDRLVEEGSVEGLVVGSDDGFVVARSSQLETADFLAVVGTVFEFVAGRIHSGRLMGNVEEFMARGSGGEMLVMRYLPGLGSRFFVVAFSRQPATYRRTMARALRVCAEILSPGGGDAPKSRRPRSRPAPAIPAPIADPVLHSDLAPVPDPAPVADSAPVPDPLPEATSPCSGFPEAEATRMDFPPTSAVGMDSSITT
ncbi:MAG: hypothetical protein IT580_21290 [Verrucomicrobiales bacterium]|nr:hypothetical protein [Verrucomicrobiales bacterium]